MLQRSAILGGRKTQGGQRSERWRAIEARRQQTSEGPPFQRALSRRGSSSTSCQLPGGLEEKDCTCARPDRRERSDDGSLPLLSFSSTSPSSFASGGSSWSSLFDQARIGSEERRGGQGILLGSGVRSSVTRRSCQIDGADDEMSFSADARSVSSVIYSGLYSSHNSVKRVYYH